MPKKRLEEESLEAGPSKRRRATISSQKKRAHSDTESSIEMENFMCHSNFKADFISGINFICGNNGSGKSAVLTAITVCLGGRAAGTQRAKKVVDFIKDGCSSAVVRIWLHNGGEDGYKRDEYGDEICVERRISRDGGTVFKTRNSNGNVVSTGKNEVNGICNYFGLVVDNPLVVLNQETAKQFLQDSSEEKKYEASNLQTWKEGIDFLKGKMAQMQGQIKLKEKNFEALKKEYESTKRQYEQMQEIYDFNEQLERKKDDLIWAMYEEKVKEMERLEAEMIKQEEEMILSRSRVDKCEERIKEIEEEMKGIEEENEESVGVIEPMQEKKSQVEGRKREIGIEIKGMIENVKEFDMKIKDYKERVENIEQSIVAEESKNNLSVKNKANEEKKMVSERIEMVKKEIASKKQELFEVETRVEEKEREERNAERMTREIRDQIGALKRDVEDLSESSKNRMARFGRECQQVLSMIEGRKFNKKPVGPFGAFVEIIDEEWNDVIQCVIGREMRNFAVDNHYDKMELMKIFERCNYQASVIVMKFNDLLDTSRYEPSSQVKTIKRNLKITNEIVESALKLNSKIERIGMFQTRKEAATLMRQGIKFIDFSVSKDNLLRIEADLTVPLLKPNRIIPITKNFDSILNQKKQKLNSEIEKEKVCSRDLFSIKKDLENLRNNKNQLKSNLKSLQDELNKLENNLEKIENILNSVEDNSKLLSMKENLQNLNESLKLMEQQRRATMLEIGEKKKDYNEINLELKNIEKEIKLKELNRKSILEKRQILIEKITKFQREKENFNLQFLKNKTLNESIKNQLKELKLESADMKEKALSVCEERFVGKPSNAIEDEIVRLEARVHQLQKEHKISIEEITEKLRNLQSKYSDAVKVLDSTINKINYLDKSIKERDSKWHKMRTSMALMARQSFHQHMAERGYYGNIKFVHPIDDKVGKMQIQVYVSEQEKNNQSGNKRKGNLYWYSLNILFHLGVRSLSGGEKSFSTVCLLLSLWGTMSSPLRCLDEFDVFMDAVNRRQSISFLIDYCSLHKVQYVLISPQDFSTIPQSKNVRIIRMNDPKRSLN
ncbi:P-loop containing nucleoside triphosphate hydrolase protein [Rozella allomycis CSF55]|uniref:P-loop containing nucleoside triphosphate hydrolase protein n=1 Tax=Rozella allomycis (strain CSF55) TaxID=988480 RepID=A0A4P9YHZ0_ROZAC|nr:P-loop containing nucleoside triphosphate hydrolase protein [Rozella allomycis CSF55]